jgi:D-psicose/D-tagatose/L-ribulose 3-epimerase
MESFVAVNEDIIGATAIWRDIVGDPDALIADGLAFLQSQAREHDLWQQS